MTNYIYNNIDPNNKRELWVTEYFMLYIKINRWAGQWVGWFLVCFGCYLVFFLGGGCGMAKFLQLLLLASYK